MIIILFFYSLFVPKNGNEEALLLLQIAEAIVSVLYCYKLNGMLWEFSGRVLDSRPRGGGLEPHQRDCVVVLEQDTFILA